MRRRRAPRYLIVALLAGCLAAPVGPAAGQQRLAISGFVQWISGASMQVVADNGFSIRVDLQLVDQSEYNTLSNGDRVRVFGYISPDRSRLIGERIDRVDAPNVYDSYTPYPQAP
jgi:hypothetical protein